jgi:hypothetical protein
VHCSGGNERGSSSCTSAEIAQLDSLHIRTLHQPASSIHQAVCQKGDVKANFSTEFVNRFFFTRQKIKEQRSYSL